jgi:hypothetical protein
MQPKPADWFAVLPADGNAYGNDLRSDCWPVARRWVIALRRANAAGDLTRPDQQAIWDDYTALSGYDQATFMPDIGTDIAKGMTDWVSNGVRVNSQTLDVPHWSLVDPTNDAHVALAIGIAGPVMATWQLPMAMQEPSAWSNAPGNGADWTTVWAVHETVLGKTDGGALTWTRTWGMDLEVHPDIRRRYMIQIDVPLDISPGGWLQTTGLTPAGFDRDALVADMAQIVR